MIAGGATMIRVLLVEDERILREALASLLAQESDLDVVAEAASGEGALSAARRCRPDVCVLDIGLPGADGIDVAGQLRREFPDCCAMVLTGIGQPGHLRRAIAAGVTGFLLKECRPQELADAIRTVAAGGKVIDPQLAYAALGVAAGPLTERETDVLRLTAAGCSPREVAQNLSLSYGTVRNYLATAVAKVGARNRVDAIRIAKQSGWL
jgi:two-component system response regulator DesR